MKKDFIDAKTIAIFGAGTIGCAIAYRAALAGFHAVLQDVFPERLANGMAWIASAFDHATACGTISCEQRDRAIGNLKTCRSVEDTCRKADLLIEAIAEGLEAKLEIFAIFDRFAKPNAILASSSNVLSIADMAAMTSREENCIGLRFAGQAPNFDKLQIVLTDQTSQASIRACCEVGKLVGCEVALSKSSGSIGRGD